MKTRRTPANHLFNSGVQLLPFLLFGLVAPSELVVAMQPSAARVSQSFSPSGINTSVRGLLASAASISGRRYGIFGHPAGFFDTQVPLTQNDCGYCACFAPG